MLALLLRRAHPSLGSGLLAARPFSHPGYGGEPAPPGFGGPPVGGEPGGGATGPEESSADEDDRSMTQKAADAMRRAKGHVKAAAGESD